MDYLDPRKRRRHTIILYVGYVLIGIAIIIATTVLLYQAYGFGINKKGQVIQNGLVFISSQPRPASIYINGQLQGARTNTRLPLPEANYKISIRRDGYLNWERQVDVQGGNVLHYDYPLLIPKTLNTIKLLTYARAPSLVSQSPDKRWLLVGLPESFGSFDVYDLKNPAKVPVRLALPPSALTASTDSQTWQPIEWADDNQHLLLLRHYGDKSEYVLLDRQTPLQSLNLSAAVGAPLNKVKLADRKFDHYFNYDPVSLLLSTASLNAPGLTSLQTDVLAYQSYGSDTLLYATKNGASAGKARIQLKVGDRSYSIRSVADDSMYLLDIAKYDNTFYVAAGAGSENKVYIYKDPASQIGSDVFRSPTPTQVLHVVAPNFVGFSSNAQYVVTENGSQFATYDIENKRSYRYISSQPVDTPQAHATWMDGNRLTYVSGGKQYIFDYDYQNIHALGKASANFMPVFAPDFKYSYTLVDGVDGQVILSQTGLLIPSEL